MQLFRSVQRRLVHWRTKLCKLEDRKCRTAMSGAINTLIFLGSSQYHKFSLSPHFLGFDKKNRTGLYVYI